MKSEKLKTLQLLESIAEDKATTQRELSDALQMSLGLVNSFIKRLVRKGYCKVTTIPKNRVKYILTPEGAMEKTRLTYEYIVFSYQFFKSAKTRLQELFLQLETEGSARVTFYGSGELAEIALISMKGIGVELVGVVDPERAGEMFSRFSILSLAELKKTRFDALVITSVNDHKAIIRELQKAGVSPDKIRLL